MEKVNYIVISYTMDEINGIITHLHGIYASVDIANHAVEIAKSWDNKVPSVVVIKEINHTFDVSDFIKIEVV